MCSVMAQEAPKKKPPYDRKEEIIHNGKRYRIHNNYLTLGGGFLNASNRGESQKTLGIDFQFHIRRQHFQTGVMMSGPDFGDNNHVQGHVGYGYRREGRYSNLAAFAGANYFTGVEGVAGSPPVFYQGAGGYACIQAVSKFTYDIGLGIELFVDVSKRQNMFGFRIIAFFSGSYRGPKRNFNPNVRSENPR